jgi:hypothetical protein
MLKSSFNNIFAIGDLHGDIIPLIVCLRDCCKVIVKKDECEFIQSEIDLDAINELSKTWDDPTYIENLNYKWVGNDASVVLCGDLLDNARYYVNKKPQEFPFEEARLLKFINSINADAMSYGGKIYKVLGNHDMWNLTGTGNISKYSSKFAQNDNGYKHHTINGRLNFFKKGNMGAKLLGQDGAFLFLMIKDFIFVHGGISSTLLNFENLDNVNKDLMGYINGENNVFDDNKDTTNKLIIGSEFEKGIVWDRYFGFKTAESEHEMCTQLYDRFKLLCDSIQKNKKDILDNKKDWFIPMDNDFLCNPNKMKLVIGHCNQNSNNLRNMYTSSFKDTIQTNETDFVYSEEFSGEVYSGESGTAGKGTIYGVTVSCGNVDISSGTLNKDLPTIYRLDVGMSRAFNRGTTNETMYSRTPQVLKIIYTGDEPNVRIVKSSLQNTKIHVPLLDCDPYTDTCEYNHKKSMDVIYMKYMKYKKKYLSLQNKIKKLF